MNFGEAHDVNTLLDYLVGEPRPGLGVPTDEQARVAGEQLLEKARPLMAARTPERFLDGWPKRDICQLVAHLLRTRGEPIPVASGDDTWEAGERLAGKAHRALYAGFSPEAFRRAWARQRVIERPAPVGTSSGVYATNGDHVWLVRTDLDLPAYEVHRDPDTREVTISPLGQPWKALEMTGVMARRVFEAGIAATDPAGEGDA